MQIHWALKRLLPLLMVWLSSLPAFGAEKHALLIGISDYRLSAGFSDLNGPSNDIGIMETVLGDRRFDFDQVTVLFNEEATHSGIAKAFERLAAKARKKSVRSVYIYYSGHGSQVRDLNGDERQFKDLHGNPLPSYDQTWVTYGSRLKADVVPPEGHQEIDRYDILDDQIAQWLKTLAAHCDQVVFVSDSCHSGSVSRNGIMDRNRKGPIDKRRHPLGARKYTPVDSKNVVRVGASKDHQLAKEFMPAGARKSYGIFTWYWAEALRTCSPDDTWSHLFSRMSRAVQQQSANRQFPQISGAVTMKVFGADFLPPAKTISIYQVKERKDDNLVFIAAGRLSGVTAGSEYTLEEKAGQPDAPVIKISKVEATRSTAVTRSKVREFDQIVETRHRYESPPTRLFFKAAHKKDERAHLDTIRSALEALEPYQVTGDPRSCDLVVYLFRPGSPWPSTGSPDPGRILQPPRSDESAEAHIWILDTSGYLYQNDLRHANTREGLATLSQNLLKLSKIKDFMRVTTPDRSSPLEITVTPMTPVPDAGKVETDDIPNRWPTEYCKEKSYKPLAPMSLSGFLNMDWNLCTTIRFNAKNPTSSTQYLYIVSVGHQGRIEPVFPHIEESAQVAEIKPGSQNEKGAAFIRLDTRTRDQYKIIVSKRPINHLLFYQPGFMAASGNAKRASSSNPLESIIINALTGKRSAVTYECGSWYAETITIDMR